MAEPTTIAETTITLEVPPSDSPDNVTEFVRQLQQNMAPGRGVTLELEISGRRRYLHLRMAGDSSPAPDHQA